MHPSSDMVRILIVEDDPADVELAVVVLKRAGYPLAFDVVDTPASFRQKLEQSDYQLILCDHNLRTWTGMEALEILRQSQKRIPFVLFTAALGDEAAVEYIKRGAADYVLKHRLQRLPAVVGQALREKASQEEALRLQEEILRGKREWELTFDAVPHPVLLLDEACRVRRTNRAAAEALGRGFADLIGKHFCEVLSPSAEHGPGCALAGKLEGSQGERFDLEAPEIGRIFEVTAAPIRGADGVLRGYVCVMHDITERQRAEEALRESEERFRQLFEEAPIAYHEIDPEGVIRRVNRTECELLGYAPEEMIGRPVWEFVAPEQRDMVRDAVRSKLAGPYQPVPFHREWLRRDGGRLTVEMHENVILDSQGQVSSIRTAVLDITERRRAEEALRRNEQFLSSVFASIQDGISVLDRDMNVVRVNPTMERWNARAMPLVGKKCWEAYHGRNTPCDGCPSRRTLETGQVASGVHPRMGPDGKLLGWVDLHSFALLDAAGGQVVGVIEYIRDISEHKKLEEQFQQAQKMEAVGRLAGGVAHDFNNLLMVIQGYSELLLQGPGQADSWRQPLEEIRKAAERATALTRQLLAFSRKQILQPQILDLNGVVSNVHTMLRRLIGEDIELTVLPGAELNRVLADPGQIEQVIMNLAVNARDAMPRGGKLTIETANVDLDEDYARRHRGLQPGPYVQLSVSDTGCGMDAETQAHIFEPFFTTKERGKGTGLGLATVYGIVKQSGGNIWAYSEAGRGTVFKIYLPRAPESAEVRQQAEVQKRLPGGVETILVAEDDAAVQALVCGALADKGYTVLEARDGPEALAAAQKCKEPIHLLITDVVLPHMGGRKLSQRLLAQRPETRLLYMSGYTDDAIVNHGVLAGNAPFLQKPFSAEALSRKVREVLDQPHARAGRKRKQRRQLAD